MSLLCVTGAAGGGGGGGSEMETFLGVLPFLLKEQQMTVCITCEYTLLRGDVKLEIDLSWNKIHIFLWVLPLLSTPPPQQIAV